MSDPTYVTVADSAYFLGAVALVNSLRLTGNAGPIVVLDAGLTSTQREVLGRVCEVRPIPLDHSHALPLYFKPCLGKVGLHGTVVLLDSDMIVTQHLGPLCEPASRGAVCVFPDGMPDRSFPDWRRVLGIEAPLRSQAYVNSGFVALDVDRWSDLLDRWLELCDRASLERSGVPWGVHDAELAARDPFLWADQDVFNALLMTEVQPADVHFLDARAVGTPGWPDPAAGGTIVDRATLHVEREGRSLAILHYWSHPKPWAVGARPGLMFDAYVELMARLLTADDVPVSVPRSIVPRWLRDDVAGRVVRRGPRAARRAASPVVRLLPGPVERRLRAAASVLLDPSRR